MWSISVWSRRVTRYNPVNSGVKCVGTKRFMGGYIEDAQLTLLGLEIYREIHQEQTVSTFNSKENGLLPERGFIVPIDGGGDDRWPQHLWGYALGEGVHKYIVDSPTGKSSANKAKDPYTGNSPSL